ncbi:phosphoesterase [Bifidobacterium margollesii]|uniref:Phosphoesterase n=1 Tax=Bifidobacterium margollesii TaxID=2020964 RepID=A0A2N5J810_9BIFI|nr:phosphatase PAP2 family protein [Bifidobacterium margollesii]PLS30349.1 phosphoesterase [Bifidobacterium margollesii]
MRYPSPIRSIEPIIATLTALTILLPFVALVPIAQASGEPSPVQSEVTPRAVAERLPNPDLVSLLGSYERYYWQPPKDGSGGKVLDASTMELDQRTAVTINHLAARDRTADGHSEQQKRALVDSDLYGWQTMPDSLGPVLGRYMREGLHDGSLALVDDLFKFDIINTFRAKNASNHPRPYLDRSNHGANDLAGLSPTLDIIQVQSWGDHIPGYDNLKNNSSFPSGHTTFAYSWGVALAGMIPELAPQIMARTSEAGNNRIVLGVHYPLDVIGGRIAGSAQNGQYWHNEFDTKVKPAADQLRAYLTDRCRADGHGGTLDECIERLDAAGKGGYRNDFTDPVSRTPVRDRQSAITAYGARMTYGFDRTETKDQPFISPDGAADILRIAYPRLHVDQRNEILRLTAIESGYPLSDSSKGWQRIDFAKALCAQVTLNRDGDVVNVVPGADRPTVIGVQYADNGIHPQSDRLIRVDPDNTVGSDDDAIPADQRGRMIGVCLAVIALCGVILLMPRPRRS